MVANDEQQRLLSDSRPRVEAAAFQGKGEHDFTASGANVLQKDVASVSIAKSEAISKHHTMKFMAGPRVNRGKVTNLVAKETSQDAAILKMLSSKVTPAQSLCSLLLKSHNSVHSSV
ncbi:unnamed protein product [Linum trigynum]|uniref:Uncharacterized protein n=1 Tax=Linum trigynum TaxID=586398 RepID=A0AAV2G6T8_9ROSI